MRFKATEWVIRCFFLATMLLVIVPGTVTPPAYTHVGDTVTTYTHGWPAVFLWRNSDFYGIRETRSRYDTDGVGIPWSNYNSWCLFRSHQYKCYWRALAWDIIVVLAMLSVHEKCVGRLRTARVRTFSLASALLMFIAVATVLAKANSVIIASRHENHVAEELSFHDVHGTFNAVDMPEFVVRLFGNSVWPDELMRIQSVRIYPPCEGGNVHAVNLLTKLGHLERVSVSADDDAGLLAELKVLRFRTLHLEDCAIDASRIRELEGFSQLDEVSISTDGLSEIESMEVVEAVRRLRSKVPFRVLVDGQLYE